MSRELIYEKLNNIFRRIFDDETIELEDDTNSDDIEDWDSFNKINLILEIEKEFNIVLDNKEITNLANIGEMVDLIISKINN